jgi:methylenetetrahydrofolate reductase (NADPH)
MMSPKLLLPFEPTTVFLSELAAHKAANPDFNIRFTFPWRHQNQCAENGGASAVPANPS